MGRVLAGPRTRRRRPAAGGGQPASHSRLRRALGRLAKTDALGAEVIALFAEGIRPEPRPVSGPDAQVLSEHVARCRQLVEMNGMEKNRARQARDKRVQKSFAATLKPLETHAALDRDIGDAVRGSTNRRLDG